MQIIPMFGIFDQKECDMDSQKPTSGIYMSDITHSDND